MEMVKFNPIKKTGIYTLQDKSNSNITPGSQQLTGLKQQTK